MASDGCVNWSWSQEKMKKDKGWETVMTTSIYRFWKKEEEDWKTTRTSDEKNVERHNIAILDG